MSPKLVFSLTYLGTTDPDTHWVHFRPTFVDPRAIERWVDAETGWVVIPTADPSNLDFNRKRIYLSKMDNAEARIVCFELSYGETPQIALGQVLTTLTHYVAQNSELIGLAVLPRSLTPEVAESLREAEPIDEEEEDTEEPAPVYLDEFHPHLISLA